MKLLGSIYNITYYNQETGYAVVRVTIEDELREKLINELDYDELYSNYLTVVSSFVSLPYINQTYEFDGDFEYSKYGLQFRSEKATRSIKQTEDGIVSYLASPIFKGVGKKTAYKIYEKLGDEAIKKIIQDKSVLDGLNIKKKQIDLIHDTLVENFKTEEDLVELLSLGLTLKLATRIIKTLGKDAKAIVYDNPYELIGRVEGIGFLRADDIGKKVGIKEDSKYRLSSLIMYSLVSALFNNGNTYINSNDLYLESLKMIKDNIEILPKDKYEALLDELINEKKIIKENGNIFDVKMYYAECDIAKSILRLLNANQKNEFSKEKVINRLNDVALENNISYNDKQKEAIVNAIMEPVSIITGGPGTGKSTIVKAIIDTYVALHKTSVQEHIEKRIMLLAPTGRAAKRLREITYHDASTIHHALGYTGYDFTVDFLDADMIIVDEMSMVDVFLGYHLFKAIKGDTKLLLVGDANQLPAVGSGDVLNDLILSKEISCVKLNQVHRQNEDSSIVTLAHYIKDGSLPYDILDKKKDRNFIQCDNAYILSYIITTIKRYLEKCEVDTRKIQGNITKELYALVNDVQVLVPMYKGIVGIDVINARLQEELNPKGDGLELVLGNKKYRKFDKVIQLVNRSDKDIMNGDIGYISDLEFEDGICKLVKIKYSNKIVEYEVSDLDDISLAYAISIHKAQGSEFNLGIVPFSFHYYVMLKRKLIYTAITRAKKYLIMIGNYDALRKGIITEEEKRKTMLTDRLKALVNGDSNVDIVEIDENNLEISPYDFMEE